MEKIGYYISKGKCLRAYAVKKLNKRTNKMKVKKVNYKGKAIRKGTKIYKRKADCMKKIKNALNIGETDIFYKVPSENNVYKHYKSNECLYYIQKKLRKNNFQTFIDLKENMIFITSYFKFK